MTNDDAAANQKVRADKDEDSMKVMQARIRELEQALSIAMVGGDYMPTEKKQLLKVLNGV